jgi:hypothetical protein
VATSLTIAGIPNRLAPHRRQDLVCSIWVPPEWAAKAKEIVTHDAVPVSELEAEALRYPPPDDA